tara:strand:+ start:100 stop:1614 length:1515 start_codon:yes stop_codon:yes gene_type:complete
VESTNAGNKYAYDGAAILQLQYGTTHRLRADETVSPDHPWYVSTDSAGAGSNAWSSSPAPSTNVDWTFTVDVAWCQQPLYGSCLYHANMGSRGAFDVSGCPTPGPSAQPSASPTSSAAPTAAPSSAPTAVQETFDDFKETFDKVYATPEEEVYRLQVFQENMEFIRANLDPDVYGVTPFIDLTYDEFRRSYLMNVSFTEPAVNASNASPLGGNRTGFGASPWIVDWRPYSTHIFNQGECGSCWAVAVVAQVETAWKIAGGPLREYSTQHILDCVEKSNVCNGGHPKDAYDRIMEDNGLPLEQSKPYVQRTTAPTCEDLPVAGGEVLSYRRIRTAGTFLEALDVQPVVVCINGAFGHMYSAGVIKCGGGAGELSTHPWDRSHCLVAVGYSESAIMLRNSWGRAHGINGYAHFDRDSCIDHIASFSYSVDVNASAVNRYGDDNVLNPPSSGNGPPRVIIVIVVLVILAGIGGAVAYVLLTRTDESPKSVVPVRTFHRAAESGISQA